MSRRPSARIQSAVGLGRNPLFHNTKQSSRPISAKERYELGSRKKDNELRKYNELKETVDSFKKKEFQAGVYNSLSLRTNRYAEVELKEKERKEALIRRKQRLRELFKNDEEIYKEMKMKQSRPSETRTSLQVAMYPEVESLRLQLANLKKKNAEDREKMAQQLSNNNYGRNHQTSRIFF